MRQAAEGCSAHCGLSQQKSPNLHDLYFRITNTQKEMCFGLFAGLPTACEQTAPVRKLYDIWHCCVYSEKRLMMDRGTVRNM